MPLAIRSYFRLAALCLFLAGFFVSTASASSGEISSVTASGAFSFSSSALSGTVVRFSSGMTVPSSAASGAVSSSGSKAPFAAVRQPLLVQTGLRAEHNLPEEILGIEKRYPGSRVSTVAFIYDEYGTGTDANFRRSVRLLGADRVYHVTLSPLGHTAAEVASGSYDAEYARFFKTARELKIRVLFRTMHEMNGGWYSWASHPEDFKKAFRRVHALARKHALTPDRFKFVFSVNSLDLPTMDGEPTQTSPLIHCEFDAPLTAERPWCPTFEDYWPGDEYVDVVGTTLYNWGRAKSERWAGWKTAEEMLGNYGLLVRLERFKKPVGLDEVWTTSARFDGKWSWHKARNAYLENAEDKNAWIADLTRFAAFGGKLSYAVYFNVDKTYGLSVPVHGELDWKVLSQDNPIEYRSALNFLALGNGKGPYAPKTFEKPRKRSFKTAGEKSAP